MSLSKPIFVRLCQGFVLVYDVTNDKSFQSMDRLKKSIEKHKEKKEVWSDLYKSVWFI